MTTLSAARTRGYTNSQTNAYPISSSTTIWGGAAVGIDMTTGLARAIQPGDPSVGFAKSSVNHILGQKRDVFVTVVDCGQVVLAVSGAAQTSVGKDVYATDDDTFTLTSPGGSFIGVAKQFVSAGKLLVEISPPFNMNVVRRSSDGLSLVDGDGTLTQVGREMSYMASILSQPSRQMSGRGNPGILVSDFTSTSSWSIAAGTPTLTQDYSGYDSNGAITGVAPRTGIASMLKVVPSSDSSEEIQNTSMTAIATGGIFGLWVYVAAQPGFQAGVGTGTGTIGVLLSTSAASFSNALQISFIATGFREGWNFLKYNENADASRGGPGHPIGINRVLNGTGANGDIVTTTVKRMKVITTTLSGATVYLDSIWTGFSTRSALVLGSDSNGTDFTTYALPLFQRYGWQRKGYLAVPRQVWASGTKVVADWTVPKAVVDTAYAAGFEVLNHTVNHLAMGTLTDAGQIAYELEACRGWALGKGWLRGSNFYVSPQFSTSRLSQTVAENLGFVMQRHARKWNIARTPWGIDNPNYIGSIDMGQASQGWQQYSNIKAAIDKCVAYGDSLWLFWHSITALGDPGTGEGTTGDDLLIYLSNFQAVLAYIASLEAAGTIDVLSPTEFYYGE